ncbi:hypothetical protein Q763_04335 [Flavobacterium beibuense F44-8]|uniref:Uncharacterized protein n=2 Tax=Flavobacterium beibuense TaxID=657326 RepID=A0A0A2LVK3_9FLAO|nr:hypothetical protein Q763_04335 [Flavobacterium beibuense F44-8]
MGNSNCLKGLNFFMLVLISVVNIHVVYSQDMKSDSSRINSIIADISMGREATQLFVITDRENVALINRYIDARNREKEIKENELKLAKENMLGERYKKGDKTTIPQIIAILKSRDVIAISDLFNELELEYDATKRTTLFLDDSIKKELFPLIEEPELEHTIVQFLGYNRVEGYIKLFEERLLSGKSTNEDRILYWLGSDGTSEKTVDYCINPNEVKSSALFGEDLSLFLQNGTPEIKVKILNFMTEIVLKNPVKESFFYDTPSEDTYLPSDFITVEIHTSGKTYTITGFSQKRKELLIMNCISEVFAHGNTEQKEKVKKAFLKSIDNFENEELKATLKNNFKITFFETYDPSKQIEIIENTHQFTVLNNFNRLCHKISEEKKLAPEVYVALFKKFDLIEKIRRKEAWFFTDIFKYLPNFTELTQAYIEDDITKQEMLERYDRVNQTEEYTDKYIRDIGLVDNDFDAVVFKTNDFSYDDLVIYKSLYKAGISIEFDTESSAYPADHDNLILEFVKHTRGKLSGVKAYQETRFNAPKDSTDTQLFVTYKDKCYVMFPENFGDWYDMDTFLNLLNTIVKEAGIKEEFVAVYTGDQYANYIFGERKKVEKLKKDYKLDYTYEEEGY